MSEPTESRPPAGQPPDPAHANLELALAIRELGRVTHELQQLERRHRLLLEGIDDGVLLLNDKGRLQTFNQAALRIVGGTEADLQHWLWGDLGENRSGATTRPVHPAMETLLDGKVRLGVEMMEPAADGAERWLRVNARAVFEPGMQRVRSVVCSFSDATARKAQQLELERQATVDPLTGTLNRRYLDTRLVAEVSRARRFAQPLSLALSDLDRFKQVNDRYGHAGGDRALRVFADILRETLRTEDVVARLGGDEFGVLFPGTQPRQAVIALERVLKRLRTTDIESDSGRFRVSGTFGVAGLEPTHDAADLMAKADAALYAAKSAGRGRVGTA